MKWCTVSEEEQKKCEWLSTASINQGLVPIIKCVQKMDKLECLQEIKEKNVDIVDMDDYGYVIEK